MNAEQWAFECAEEFHHQWPRVPRDDLENLAQALWREQRWCDLTPSQAALEWLRQDRRAASPRRASESF